jgi:hypothetical protein
MGQGLAPAGHDSLLFEFPTIDILRPSVIKSLSLDVESILRLLGIRRYSMNWSQVSGYPTPARNIRYDVAQVKETLAKSRIFTLGRWGSHALMDQDQAMGEILRGVNYMMTGEEGPNYKWSMDAYPMYWSREDAT